MPTLPGLARLERRGRAGARVVRGGSRAYCAAHRYPRETGRPWPGPTGSRVYASATRCSGERTPPSALAVALVGRAFRDAPRALPRRPARLRRHLPRAPGRRRPHVGGPADHARRPRAQGRHAPRARRHHRHRRRHLAAPARGRALRASRRSPQRTLYARGDLDLAVAFEGLFRLPNGRDAAAARPRRPRRRAARLDADDGRRAATCC